MSTFYESAKSMLLHNGMGDADAETVMTLTMNAEENTSMRGRWSDKTEDYPPVMLNLVLLSVRDHAYKWICQYAPQAWFRPVFSPGALGLSGSEITAYLDQYEIEHPDWKIATHSK